MIERAMAAQIVFALVTGDEVYGDNGPLRARLDQQHLACVLAVASDHRIPAAAGRTVRADELAARPGEPGSGYPQARAPRETAGMTGHGSSSTTTALDTGAC
jgi:hypothetical protein